MKTYFLIAFPAFAAAAPTVNVAKAPGNGTTLRLVALMSSPPGSTRTPILPVTASGLTVSINGTPNVKLKKKVLS
jgi:hypothetical protein